MALTVNDKSIILGCFKKILIFEMADYTQTNNTLKCGSEVRSIETAPNNYLISQESSDIKVWDLVTGQM